MKTKVSTSTFYSAISARVRSTMLMLSLALLPALVSATPACVTNEVTQLNLVNAPSGSIIAPLTNNYVINKALISGGFSVDAITCNGTVGSVVFTLNGSKFRTESVAPYSINGDRGGDFYDWNPAVGSYTLEVTPYTGSGGSGTAGIAITINIQVIDQPIATDCNGVLNGTAFIDACGDCAGGNTGVTPNQACSDCAGVPNGTAVIDDCGDCVLGSTGLAFNSGCNIDCAGVIDGTAAIDACGVCAGGTTGNTPNATCTDCAGVVNGGASVDDCGQCSGGTTGITPNSSCADCAGVANGTASVDTCGVCSGGTTGISPNSTCGACVPNQVTELVLMQAGAGGTALGNIQNGDIIIKSVTGPFSIDALVCSDPDVESVIFEVNGSVVRTENLPPYAIEGDNASNGFKSWNVPAGSYTVTATPYSGNNGSGNMGVPKTVSFTILDNAPLVDCNGDNGGSATIDQCGVCSGGNTGKVPNATCSDCAGVPNGSASVDACGVCSGGTTGITPNASCTDCAGVLNGTAAVDACGVCAGGSTGVTPYASCTDCAGVVNGTAVTDDCGDCVLGNTGLAFNGGCNIDCAGVVDGSASIDACGVCAGGTTGVTANASCTDCAGVVNGTASIDGCGVCSGGTTGIVPNSSCGGCTANEVTALMLINSSNNTDIGAMQNGDTIDLSVLPDFSLRADVCSEPDVKSVVFSLNGSNIRTENIAPYSVNGDNNGNYTPWPLSAGTYTVSATPYSGNSGSGTAGVAETVLFYVVDGPPVTDCNGVLGGTAYTDGCGNCVGGNTGLTPCIPSAGCGEFIEVNGLVVVEIESEPVANNNWYVGTGSINGLNVPTPSGTAYYMWQVNCVSGTAPNYVYSGCGGSTAGNNNNAMSYEVNISSPGRYRLQMRTWQPSVQSGSHAPSTENNDCWIQLPDGGGIKKKNSTEIAIGTNEWVKIYQNSPGGWRWVTNTVDNNPHQIYIDFPAPGTYTIKVGARSKLFAIDRFVLYRSDNASSNVDESFATSMARAESPRGSCGGARVVDGPDQTAGNNQQFGEAGHTATANSLENNDLSADGFRVNAYPNPTTGILHLQVYPAEVGANLEVYDVTGKLMIRKQLDGENTSVDLSPFANGLYWIKIQNGLAVRMEHIYKQ